MRQNVKFQKNLINDFNLSLFTFDHSFIPFTCIVGIGSQTTGCRRSFLDGTSPKETCTKFTKKVLVYFLTLNYKMTGSSCGVKPWCPDYLWLDATPFSTINTTSLCWTPNIVYLCCRGIPYYPAYIGACGLIKSNEFSMRIAHGEIAILWTYLMLLKDMYLAYCDTTTMQEKYSFPT